MTAAPLEPSRSVLLVDDTATMRQVVRLSLELDPAWEVIGEAVDGREAIEQAERLRPDVIVLDQQMPHLDGVDALPTLRTSCPTARIVMWSSDPDVREHALASGADGFTDKAAPLDDLLAAIT